MSSRILVAAIGMGVLGLADARAAESSAPTEIRLADLNLAAIQQGIGQAKKNLSIDGQPIRIGGKTFDHGIGTHARSEMRLLLDGKASRLTGQCGLDEASAKDPAASIECEIVADGAVIWRSGVMKTGWGPAGFDVALDGVRDLRLRVGDAGDGMSADRANWADAVIRFTGVPPRSVDLVDGGLASQLPPVKEAAGGPPNAPAEMKWDAASGYLQVLQGKKLLLRGTLANGASVESRPNGQLAVEQHLVIANGGESINLIVHGGKEAIAAETRGEAQKRFPLVRTAFGPSDNLRNNAVYDSEADWMFEFPAGSRITSLRAADQTMRFEVKIAARDAILVFRPRYFQKHKNLPYHQPWASRPARTVPAGWDLTAAYPEKFGPAELGQALEVWKQTRLGDYGVSWIAFEALPPVPKKVDKKAIDPKKAETKSSVSTTPAPSAPAEAPKPPAFPGGNKAIVDLVKKAGAAPAVKVAASAGSVWESPGWFRDLSKQGVGLFQFDRLDRDLYRQHESIVDLVKQKRRPEDAMRAALTVARKEAGRDAILLAGNGVMPEVAGLVDGLRLNGEGFSPAGLQQYSSWNGIVWRNAPGPLAVLPGGLPLPAEAGAEPKPLTDAQLLAAIWRPVLVSIGGGALMLADPAPVYRDPRLLVGLRKSVPVVASLSGQLFDFDDSKTAWFRTGERTDLRGENAKSPTDADLTGAIHPWWLNEYDTPVGHWNVLHRVNASDAELPGATVRLADVGIDPKKRYLVHEFWSDTFLGVCRDSFDIPALPANGLQSYVIREAFDRPQVVSTNRHHSQGAVDLEIIGWNESTTTLEGRSRIVADDRYTLTIDLPPGYRPMEATVGDRTVDIQDLGRYCRVSVVSPQSGSIVWSVRFVR